MPTRRMFLLSLIVWLATYGKGAGLQVRARAGQENLGAIANNDNKQMETKKITIKVGRNTLVATLADNSSARAFAEKLKNGDITVRMEDYSNFEKVGSLGFSLPTNDTRIVTGPGDVILYQGRYITIYYDRNTWSFTRLGKIEGATKEGLLSILGRGDVTVTFSLE